MCAKVYFPPEQKVNITKSGDIAPKKKAKTQGWVNSLGPLFHMMAWMNKYNLIRKHWMYPPRVLMMWGHLIGAILKKSGGMRYKIKQSMVTFYPNASKKQIAKLVDASCKYFGMLFIDLIFNLPLTTQPPYQKLFRFENIERLDAAYEQGRKEGRGVIMMVTHLADFLNTMPGFSVHPHKYMVASVANLGNSIFYQYLINKPIFERMWVYPSISFKKIGHFLERHLKDGFLLIMYSDYSSPKQMRAPMWEGKFPYLINTVQSIIRLQRKTNAIMVPVITTPDGVMGKTKFVIADNTQLMDTIEKYRDAPDKEFHGRLSMEINRALYPWIRKYAHCWEEIMNFETMRLTDRMKFPAQTTMNEFLTITKAKFEEIINNSWEPNRDDQAILDFIQQTYSSLDGTLNQPEAVLRPHKCKAKFEKMTGWQEFEKLAGIVSKELKLKEEQKTLEKWQQFLFGCKQYFGID